MFHNAIHHLFQRLIIIKYRDAIEKKKKGSTRYTDPPDPRFFDSTAIKNACSRGNNIGLQSKLILVLPLGEIRYP